MSPRIPEVAAIVTLRFLYNSTCRRREGAWEAAPEARAEKPMGPRSKLLLVYAPPIALGLVALVAFPVLRTGDARADYFIVARKGLVAFSIIYTLVVALGRLATSLGRTPQEKPGPRGFEVRLKSPPVAPSELSDKHG